jgi:uncharacterized protein YndB with AHSA1/START domain
MDDIQKQGELFMSSQPVKKNIVVTRVFDAPIEKVWKAWYEPDEVMQWWGPTGFTSPSARMDFREGGTSIVHMRAAPEFGGMDLYNTWTYTRIVPMERFEFIQNFSDEQGNTIEPATIGLPPDTPTAVRNLVTFKVLNDNRTEMTVTEFDYTSDEILELSRMGLEQCLDKMKALLL